MRVLVSGASGLIGSALSDALRGAGHDVATLVRREPAAPGEFGWDPSEHRIDPAALDGIDAVVNLSGASVAGRRWSASYRRQIRQSRIDSTSTLVKTIAERGDAAAPAVLVSGSAIGFYGDTGDTAVDEASPAGEGFLAGVVRDWEECAEPARKAGVRVVLIRTGIVLAREGGALGTVLPLLRLGLGGRLGSGRQWMSWISLADEIAAIQWLLSADRVEGPVNLTAPQPVTNADYTDAIGRILHRPMLLPAPAFALRLALGGLADEGPLVSQRVVPARLLANGFDFAHPQVDDALRAALTEG